MDKDGIIEVLEKIIEYGEVEPQIKDDLNTVLADIISGIWEEDE